MSVLFKSLKSGAPARWDARYLVLIAAYIVLAPFCTPYFTPSPYDGARFLEIAFLLAAVLSVVSSSRWRSLTLATLTSLPKHQRLALASLALITLTSAFRSRLPQSAYLEISLFLLLILLGAICANLARLNRYLTDRVLATSFAGAALIFIALFAVTYAASVSSALPFSWISPFVSFANVRFFSQYQAYTLPLLIIPAIAFDVPRRWRVAAQLLTSWWWMLHFTTGTRAVWLAAIMTALLLFASLGRTAKEWGISQGIAFLFGGLFYALFTQLNSDNFLHGIGSVIDRGLDDNGRWPLWQTAFNIIESAPWFGIGPIHFALSNFTIAAHPHNAWLHVAAEYGLPAALIVTFLVFGLLVRVLAWCRTAVETNDRHINVALVASLQCGLIDALFSGNIIMPQSQMTLFIVGGWLIGRNWRVPRDYVAVSISRDFRWSQFILSILLIVAISTQLSEARYYYEYMADQGFALPEYAHPRYWHNGHLSIR